MLAYLILLLISSFLVILYIERSYQLHKIKKHSKKIEKELHKNSTLPNTMADGLVDTLTALPGRQSFDDRMTQTLNQSKRFENSFAVMVFNVIDFSQINTTYTYDIGDKLLKEIGARLHSTVRQIDTVSRYGADKFYILLPQLTLPETAAYVAQRIFDSLDQSFIIEDKQIYVHANMGIAIYPLDGKNNHVLIRNAESALRDCKKLGANKFQFFSEQLQELSQRELNLKAFIKQPTITEHLVIYYQSRIDVDTSKVVSVQAFLYLKHPEFGLVSFSDFGKLADNCGRSAVIGEWLLDQVFKQFSQWQQESFPIKSIVVNTRLKQIEDDSFMQRVFQLLTTYNMRPNQVEFEIPADNLSSRSEKLDKAFEKLFALGIPIGVSIFGLGHLALGKITKLPLNYLKIDSKLINETPSLRSDNAMILDLIISLAKELKINVMAEGVRTEEQKKYLLKIGCHVIQGSLYGDPVPLENFKKLLID